MFDLTPSRISRIIYTTGLFILGTMIGLYLYYRYSTFWIFRFSYVDLSFLFLLPIFNEIGQYIGFLTIGGLRTNEVRFNFSTTGVNIFVSNLIPIKRMKFILIIVYPMVFNILFTIVLMLVTHNVFYALLLSFVLGVSSNDLPTVFLLLKAPHNAVVMIDEDARVLAY